MDRVDPTHARGVVVPNATWDADAQERLRDIVQALPVLIQISAAKQLRDLAERHAREAVADSVGPTHVEQAARALGMGVPA
jgi:chlorophyllide a reductase subunit Z